MHTSQGCRRRRDRDTDTEVIEEYAPTASINFTVGNFSRGGERKYLGVLWSTSPISLTALTVAGTIIANDVICIISIRSDIKPRKWGAL